MTTLLADLDVTRRRVSDFSSATRLASHVLAGFGAVFLIWAVIVPISGAVVAPGVVVSDGKSHVLRHASGAVVSAIHVREGDHVAAGTLIAELSPEVEKAALSQLTARLAGLDVSLARLAAERDGNAFPTAAADPTLTQYAPKLVAEFMADQVETFASRADRVAAERRVLTAQREAMLQERIGLEGETDALKLQLASIAEDLELRRAAQAKGYGRAAQLREIEREHARIQGSVERADGQLKAIDEQVRETDSRLAAQAAGLAQDISAEMAKARAERLELVDQLAAAVVAAGRVEIRAPAAGIVDKLRVNTIGSAIEPFSPIAEVVPDDAPILVEARVAPIEIDDIAIDQDAEIMFGGLARKNFDPLPAKVTFISPDSHLDERTGARYFTVRLDVDREALGEMPKTGPGMVADAYFKKRDYTLLQYLLAPFTDSFSRAFR
jgi:HlyD family type I secretion membrane fusion protein